MGKKKDLIGPEEAKIMRQIAEEETLANRRLQRERASDMGLLTELREIGMTEDEFRNLPGAGCVDEAKRYAKSGFLGRKKS